MMGLVAHGSYGRGIDMRAHLVIPVGLRIRVGSTARVGEAFGAWVNPIMTEVLL